VAPQLRTQVATRRTVVMLSVVVRSGGSGRNGTLLRFREKKGSACNLATSQAE
jgi:hypothetical protein